MPAITNVFLLMLENRSFDHMLGFSGITGTDAATGQPTSINGLKGTESNIYNGRPVTVGRGADLTMPADPVHEFDDVLTQLCGQGVPYASGGAYPPVNNSGFAASYAGLGQSNVAEVMKCYTPDQLPVLNALAKEFAVCDNWFSSVPGPTWANRFFALAASSGGLEHSPSKLELLIVGGI
jgi:phospholipase C